MAQTLVTCLAVSAGMLASIIIGWRVGSVMALPPSSSPPTSEPALRKQNEIVPERSDQVYDTPARDAAAGPTRPDASIMNRCASAIRTLR